VKDLAAANQFLAALDQPAHRALCESDVLLVSLVRELIARQTRYRAMQDDHGSAICSHCPHGGCCTKEMVRVIDLLPRLAVQIPLPRALNAEANACAFLGAGCTLTPAPLPNICVAFHCGTLARSGPPGFGEQIERLAQDSEDVARVLVSYLRENFMLLDGEAEIDLRAPAVLVASLVNGSLTFTQREPGSRPLKSVAHPSDDVFTRLPIVTR
jgi:hypothetical protein